MRRRCRTDAHVNENLTGGIVSRYELILIDLEILVEEDG